MSAIGVTYWDLALLGVLLDLRVAGIYLHQLPPRSYAPGVTYGEMFYQNEYEMSCYNLDEADVAGQRARCEGLGDHAGDFCAAVSPFPISHSGPPPELRGRVPITDFPFWPTTPTTYL